MDKSNGQPVQMLITLLPNGQVEVQGPVQNRLLCYGLLESAKDAIRSYKPPLVVSPDVIPTDDVLKGKKFDA